MVDTAPRRIYLAPLFVGLEISARMQKYAIVRTGGKQYYVQEGTVLEVERLPAAEGERVELEALALHDGRELKVGTPLLEGVRVEAEVLGHLRGKKLVAFKKKRRKGYKRKVGHRQELTRVKIAAIVAG